MGNEAMSSSSALDPELQAGLDEWSRKHEAIIRSGLCPRCGAKLKRSQDSRQFGPSKNKEGRAWANYRCSTDPSHYLFDSLEPSSDGP